MSLFNEFDDDGIEAVCSRGYTEAVGCPAKGSDEYCQSIPFRDDCPYAKTAPQPQPAKSRAPTPTTRPATASPTPTSENETLAAVDADGDRIICLSLTEYPTVAWQTVDPETRRRVPDNRPDPIANNFTTKEQR